MKYKEEKALKTFNSGYSCAQAVLTAYSNDMNFDNDFGLSISCGFGSGMGKLQKTCGAVTGSYMVLGLFNSKLYTNNQDRKEKTYAMIQKFSEEFEAIHDTTNCKSLINCDLKTEEGQLFAKENNVFTTLCEKYVIDSIRILEKLIAS